MPREVERAVPQGEGAGDPVFAPSVGINTPGLAVQPNVDKFSQLQSVLFSGLGDLASGLNSLGNATEVIENKKRQVLAQQDQELAETKATLEQTRFEKAKGEQRSLLLDERSDNPQWLMEQAGARLASASTEAEKEVWFRITAAAQDQMRQDTKVAEVEAKREAVEDLNLAGLTASRVMQTLEVNLQKDTEKQAELIGNGQNIVGRVQDWVLSQVSDSDSDLFHLDENASKDEVQARDKVMGQLLSQSLGIADSLTKQYVKQVDAAKEDHAVESLDALMLGIQKGQVTDPKVVNASLKYIDDNYMNHMTSTQKDEFKSQYLNQAVKDAASLAYTEDITQASKAIDAFITQAGIPPAEAARAKLQAQTIMTRTAVSKYSAILDNELASQRTVVQTKDGSSTTVSLPVSDPIATLSGEDKYGVSLARRKAEEYLASAGLSPDRTDLTVGESSIRSSILDAVSEIEARGAASKGAAANKQAKGNMARANLLTGDATAMYETNPMFMARSPDGVLARPDLVAAVESTGSQWGMSPDVPAGVGPVAMIPETRPARAAIMTIEAQTWDKTSVHTFPDTMLTDTANKFKSKSAEDMYDVTVMFRSLSLRKAEDFQNSIGKKLTMAEMIALDTLRQASVNPDEQTWDAAFQQARNIMENDRLTPEAMAQAARDSYGQIIMEENEGMRPQARSRKGEALGLLVTAYEKDTGRQFQAYGTDEVDTTAEFEQAFREAGGFTDSTINFLASRHEAFKGLGMDDVQAANANKAMLKQDGYKIAAWGQGVKIIRDPMNVLGYKPLTETDTRKTIQAFLNAPLKGQALKNVATRFKLKPGDPVPTTYWQAMKMADPENFGTMQPTDMAPADWVLGTDDSMWETYAFRPPINGQPQAVAMLRFKDVNGNVRPISTADGELASAYSQYLFEQVEPELQRKQAERDASVQALIDKYQPRGNRLLY